MSIMHAEYARLPTDDDDKTAFLQGNPSEFSFEEKDEPDRSSLPHHRIARGALTVLFTLCLTCSIGSLILLYLNTSAQWKLYDLLGASLVRSGEESPRAQAPSTHLRRPNVYYGLDRLPASMAHDALPNFLDVFPRFFQPVDHENQGRVFPDDAHARFTFNGRVSPGDHHILLTDHISMVAQYRVQDFGMERCRVMSSVPPPEVLAQHNQTAHISGDTSRIEVWGLSAETELDERSMSWAIKPPRGTLLATLSVETNATRVSDGFFCGSSGSLQTMEFLCRGVDCRIEFWQDYYFRPRFGEHLGERAR